MSHEWSTGAWPCTRLMTPERNLTMQMVLVDKAAICCSRQFGWTDTKPALAILQSWLYLSIPIKSSGTAPRGEPRLNPERLRQFAKTIIGGMCRFGGSYQEIDDETLGPLENWLRQSLVAEEQGSGRDADIRQESAVPPSPFFEDIQVATDGRVFFLTGNGLMGLGPASMRNGDTIHVLPSGRAHFVLRKVSSGSRKSDSNASKRIDSKQPGQYELIGDCYLHTGAKINDRTSNEQELAVEGSLPFEMLGARYWKETGLAGRETIILV